MSDRITPFAELARESGELLPERDTMQVFNTGALNIAAQVNYAEDVDTHGGDFYQVNAVYQSAYAEDTGNIDVHY